MSLCAVCHHALFARQLAEHSSRIECERASLREFAPPPNSYNLVWAQWVLGHLTDTDVVGLLSRCRAALRPGGAVGVKDNTAEKRDCDQGGGRYLLDEENAAVIRSHKHMQTLYKLAGLKLAHWTLQTGYAPRLRTAPHAPPGIRPVAARLSSWLTAVHARPFRSFPEDLHPVRMYWLVPIEGAGSA